MLKKKKKYQCATINQGVSLKGEDMPLQQPWKNSPNPDFQDQYYFECVIQTLSLILQQRH